MSVLKPRQRKRHPYKAFKIDVLDFIHRKDIITVHDLIDRFGYSYNGAVRRISLLHLERLIQPVFQRGTWGLTEKACRKLEYYHML